MIIYPREHIDGRIRRLKMVFNSERGGGYLRQFLDNFSKL